jgi:hypothetical protein
LHCTALNYTALKYTALQAIAFSVIYTFCCLTKMSPNFWWLLVGRIFGGPEMHLILQY